jgi:hypothetical protein
MGDYWEVSRFGWRMLIIIMIWIGRGRKEALVVLWVCFVV